MVHHIHTPFRVMAEDLHTRENSMSLSANDVKCQKAREVTWDCMSLTRSAMMRLKEKLSSLAFARHCFSNLLMSSMSHG